MRMTTSDAALMRRANVTRNWMSGRTVGNNPSKAVMLTTGGSLGDLGDTTTKQAAAGVASVGGKVGGAALATYVGAGAWAGPIGAAAGLVVGLLAGKLLNKQYLNVAEMNAAEDTEVGAFNQYKSVQGQFPGRAVGLEAMRAVWKGALHSGHFPQNNQKQCFHQGCSKYPGNASWIDTAINGGSRDPNTFPDVYKKFSVDKARMVPQAVMTGSVTPSVVMANYGSPRGMLRGLGDFGTTPDAVVFIDQYFIPANLATGHPPWAVPTSTVEHQLLYDVADAWLAVQAGSTTPYIAAPSAIPINTPGTITAADPTQGAVAPQPTAAPPLGPLAPTVYPGPGGGSTGGGFITPGGNTGQNTYDLAPVTNPATGQTSYVMKPTPTGGSAVTAGLSEMPSWYWLLIAAGAAFALARPTSSPRRRTRR